MIDVMPVAGVPGSDFTQDACTPIFALAYAWATDTLMRVPLSQSP